MFVSHIMSRDFAVLTGSNRRHVLSPILEISCTILYHFLGLCQKLLFLYIPIFQSLANPVRVRLQWVYHNVCGFWELEGFAFHSSSVT